MNFGVLSLISKRSKTMEHFREKYEVNNNNAHSKNLESGMSLAKI